MSMSNRVKNNGHTANQGYQKDSRRQYAESLHQRRTLQARLARAAMTTVLYVCMLHR